MKNGVGLFVVAVRLLFLLLTVFPATSFATDLSEKLSINGFYTFDLSLADGADVTFNSPAATPVTVKDGEASLDNSLIGAQVDYAVTDNLKLIVQAVTSKQTDENYSPTLEWAYASLDIGDDLYLRGGQLKLPFLQGTELRNIGFSRLWARPITPSNGAGGFDEYVGGEIIKGISLGEYNVRFQGAYGVADHKQDFIENRDVKLLSARLEKEESWINLALFHARYKAYTRGRQFLIKDNAEVFMASFEAELLFESSVLNLGYVYGDDEVNPNEQLAYLSLGYRADKWTPYLLVKYHLMQISSAEFPTPPNGGGGGAPGGGGGASPPNVLDGDRETDTYSVGFRYDLGATYAVKAQVDQVYKKDDSNPTLGDLKIDYNVFTIVFEGVF